MATYTKVNSFVEALAEKVHNLGSDTLKVALTNTAPTAAGTTKLADLTGGITSGFDGMTITTSSSGQTSGTYKLVLTDLTMTATGSVGPFRYVVIYNDSATNKEVICFFDYGSEVTLAKDDTFKLDFGDQLFSLS